MKIGIQGGRGSFNHQALLHNVFNDAGCAVTYSRMEQHNSRKAILIYSSKDGYLFKDELEAIAEKDSNISVIYTINREEMQQKISDEIKAHGPDAYYYISGSPKMIKGTKSYLKENGVSGSRVVTDPFVGY